MEYLREREVLWLSLILSVIGIIFLAYGSTLVEPKKADIKDLEELEGVYVSVTGRVLDVISSKGNLFLKIEDRTGDVNVVIFEREMKRMGLESNDIRKGMVLVVEGVVQRYRGEVEVIPESITILESA
ncbi:MAG: hypothetical protein DRP11_02315 [Candidatus Aenigmatarchaeota archaeon]|nr:MAG: hypothetical protein DRP11_02315 [Candidatus Aenigmarchaeota archaeon]